MIRAFESLVRWGESQKVLWDVETDQNDVVWESLDARILAVMDELIGSDVQSPLSKLEELAWARTFGQSASTAVQVIARRLLTSQMAVREYRLLREELVWKKSKSPFTSGMWTLYETEQALSEPEQKLTHYQRVLSERRLLKRRAKE